MNTNQKDEIITILVVEDKIENISAAREFFDTLSFVEVSFARSYEEGVKKLEEKTFAGVILDVNFPRNSGGKPEKLGSGFGEKELDLFDGKYRTPYVHLTTGDSFIGHGGLVEFSTIYSDSFGMERDLGGIQTSPKICSKAWKDAFKHLTRYDDNPDYPSLRDIVDLKCKESLS